MSNIAVRILFWICLLGLLFGWALVITANSQIVEQEKGISVTYTPSDQIEWICADSQGDEIIEVERVGDRVWDFYITPDRSKLTGSDITAYPVEAYYFVYSGTGDITTHRIPVDKGLLTFESIDDRSFITAPITADDKTVNLDTKAGVRVTLNNHPEYVTGILRLKYGVHSATYAPTSNLMTVTGTPVTPFDIITYGTGPVTQCGSRQFTFGCKLRIGDDVTPTNFVGTSCQIYITDAAMLANADAVITVESNAVMTLDKSSILLNETVHTIPQFLDGGGSLAITESTIGMVRYGANDRFRVNGFDSPSYIRDGNMLCTGFYHSNDGFILDNLVVNGAWAAINQPLGDAIFNDMLITDGQYNFLFRGSIPTLVTNSTLENPRTANIYLYQLTSTATMVNCTVDDWTSTAKLDTCTHGVERQHTLDLVVTAGSPSAVYEGAQISITNSEGTNVFSGITSASGTITTQYLDYFWILPNLGTRSFSPYELTIKAVGYQDYTANVDMDEQKRLEVALLPTRSGTTAGDVLSWAQLNVATISWWEENMELLLGILLVSILLAFSFWKGEWWLYTISSLVCMGWGFYYCGESYPYYGYPLIMFGFAVFFHGAYLLFGEYKRGR